MADQDKTEFHDESDRPKSLPVKGGRRASSKRAPRLLPPWKVVLHNDQKSEMDRVVETIYQLTPLNREEAYARMYEAHKAGCSLLLVTHRERAELYVEQFMSCGLTVTIEPVP